MTVGLIQKLTLLISFSFITSLQTSYCLAATKNDCDPNSQNKALIGVWESRATSMGGLGIIMEFREDGGWVDPIGAIVDEPGKTSPPLVHIEKIPGTGGNGYAYINHTADGQTQYREPFPKPWGCYKVIGNNLRLNPANCSPQEVSFNVTKTTLELTNMRGDKQILFRVEPAWYRPPSEKEVEDFMKIYNAKQSKQKP